MEAGEVVNRFLAASGFERSLYRGLVAEGVLVEGVARRENANPEVVVFIAYERLADHLAARSLLDRCLDVNDPASAFAAEGGLAFVCDDKQYVSPCLLEALCIQIPEQTGKELLFVAPACADEWGFGDAFRQSLVWRSYAAFSQDTGVALNKLCKNEHDRRDTLDVLLTVATLPGHPLNARFLDSRLRKDAMPDRDAWWSVYLHQAYGTHGAVDRLLDWTSSLDPNASLDEQAVELCAVVLLWTLTTSNRFLRDRATMALVSLLTDRLTTVGRLVGGFAGVDDPYVVERLYAVAYGVAMRSHDPDAVGTLATCVYERVFASGSPPPHILLRDYARGVVERALHLGSKLNLVPVRVRPPYRSTWSGIPTEEDIKTLLPDWSKGSHDSGELEWARNRIGSSVMNDDFAFYVIGTNSSRINWLSLKLEDPPWKPPLGREHLLGALVGGFSSGERAAWEEFEAADKAYEAESQSFISDWSVAQREEDGGPESPDLSDSEILAQELEKVLPSEIAALEAKREQARAALEAVLSDEHAQRLDEIWSARENDDESRRPPRFELREIQRYVLWRVFDLGWTTKRFGHFDRSSIGYRGRNASKAERIGKKYQWIAYQEIMALVADHYQYREHYREDDDQAYEGPWQDYFRDIDPSCTLRSRPGGTSWEGHAVSWWGSARYDSWGDPGRPRDWVVNAGDLPKVEDLLVVTNPTDGSRWVNGRGFFSWEQQPPSDRESTDMERREFWYKCTGYLLWTDDTEAFLLWAEGIDFNDCWIPETAGAHGFLGEHAWAPASRYFQQPYYGDDGWTQLTDGCPVRVRMVTCEYLGETGGFDCSIEESYTLHLPVIDLISGLGIRWSGRGADFVDGAGRVGAQDPTVHSEGPDAMLLRDDLLGEYLAREKLTMCWAVLGEKRVISPGLRSGPRHPWLRMSGAYVLSEGRAVGFVKHMIDDPNGEGDPAAGLRVVGVARTAN